MKIITISLLNEAQRLEDSSYFETSVPVESNNVYGSRKISYKNLQEQMTEHISAHVRDAFEMCQDGQPQVLIKSSDLDKRLNQVENEDFYFNGIKTFNSIPKISQSFSNTNVDSSSIPNIAHVKKLIISNNTYIGPTTLIDDDPQNGNGSAFTVDSDMFYHWRIDHGQRDSSQFIINTLNNSTAGSETMRRSGYLTMYGWLADNGDVKAEDAWVGLFGKLTHSITIDNESGTTTDQKWIALQIQPWIIGNKSSTLLYVGFGIPVMSGLELKVMTGFKVNGNNSGFQTASSHTLTYNLNQPNSFVGYILYNI